MPRDRSRTLRPILVVPFDGPIEGAQRQHANDRQIQVCAKRARLRRALEEITPERTVSTLALQMALADLSGDLTEDADVGDRIVALRENELEVRGDRRPQSGHRVGAR